MGQIASFETAGGHPAIDFVNTLGGTRTQPDDEFLHSYSDLVSWCELAGLLDGAAADGLRAAAATDPAAAQTALQAALGLRTHLDRVLRVSAGGHNAPAADLAAVARAYVGALRQASLAQDGGGYGWIWPDPPDLRRPQWTIAVQAVELLQSGQLAALGTCAHCRWLFLDRSKNHSRRWCSMNACGAADKMRRYRSRLPRTT
jgi:predicted RNA-binding Zn ribbon-like protein